MGRTRTRSERLEHFFGDMVSVKKMEKHFQIRKTTKKEVKQTLKEICEEMGIKQCVLFSSGADEYAMRYK